MSEKGVITEADFQSHASKNAVYSTLSRFIFTCSFRSFRFIGDGAVQHKLWTIKLQFNVVAVRWL